jgi:hypothetical protein
MVLLESPPKREFRAVADVRRDFGERRFGAMQQLGRDLHAAMRQVAHGREPQHAHELPREDRPRQTDGTCQLLDRPILGQIAIEELERALDTPITHRAPPTR